MVSFHKHGKSKHVYSIPLLGLYKHSLLQNIQIFTNNIAIKCIQQKTLQIKHFTEQICHFRRE